MNIFRFILSEVSSYFKHRFRGSSMGNYGKREVDGEYTKERLMSIEFNLHGQK